MKLSKINDLDNEQWNKEISRYGSNYLFHSSEWLNFLRESQGGEILKLKIEENGRIVGYFAGIIVKKGMFKILGSPLPGSTTDYMGPIVNKDNITLPKLIKVLDELCRELGIHLLELCNPHILEHEEMIRNGFNFSPSGSYMIPLDMDEITLWESFRAKYRNQVRKAIKNGVVIERPYDIEAFIHEYFVQLNEVFLKKGLTPTYSLARLKKLYGSMKKDSIISLRARYEGKTIATGIFPHDEKRVFFFGGASLADYNHLCPNDLLHWEIMKLSLQLGIKEYDMCGGGSFKGKFGYPYVQFNRYVKYYSPLAKIGREAYRIKSLLTQRIKGSFTGLINGNKNAAVKGR